MSVLSRERKREAWSARIADYRQSGLSRIEWCERNGLPLYSLRYWLSVERAKMGGASPVSPAKAEKTEWAPVQIIEDIGSLHKIDASGGCINVFIGAARIEVKAGSDPALLSDVLKAVAAVC